MNDRITGQQQIFKMPGSGSEIILDQTGDEDVPRARRKCTRNHRNVLVECAISRQTSYSTKEERNFGNTHFIRPNSSCGTVGFASLPINIERYATTFVCTSSVVNLRQNTQIF